MVRVLCQGKAETGGVCGRAFSYRKQSNFLRKFCDDCRVSRIKASKRQSNKKEKGARVRGLTVREKLRAIPDRPITIDRALELVARSI